jgi:hypothetical protein
MDWIIENKDWLFSGVAIAIPIAIIGWFISTRGNKQVQKGGNHSTNIQVGGSLNIGGRKDDD